MAIKIKKVPILFVIAFFCIVLWGLLTVNDFRSQDRTSTLTTPALDSQLEAAEKNLVNESAKPQSNENEAWQKPEHASPVSNSGPGSKLSDEAKEKLGITEPIEEEQIFYTTAVPNDAIYPQWYTTIIDAPQAWDITTGSPTTLVAVIDTGFALSHEDLSSAWFVNDGEQGSTSIGEVCWSGSAQNKQTNNCDDDGNGLIDDWRGWDFANADNFPQAGDNYAAGATHGTKSAGLVGGRSNNSVGVASVNWETQILPIQALFDEGYGYSTDIASAVYYAVEMGADVINMSLGGAAPDSYTLAAIRYATQNNVIVVASSGNCGDVQTGNCAGYPSPGGMGYPGRYPDVIAVGATDNADTRAYFSSWGDEITIVAPGSGSIQTPTWSTTNEINGYAPSSFGTSFSAPIVSGAIALLKAQYPDITTDEVKALIANSSDKVAGMAGSFWHNQYGYGRLNVLKLLQQLVQYQTQLTKADGVFLNNQNNTTKPLVTTNTGHTRSNGIINATTLKTYCITTPGTICTFKLTNQISSSVIVIGSQRANNQGLALFEWSKSDAYSGTWDATVSANGMTSNKEELVIL
jgi:hypothetical protein